MKKEVSETPRATIENRIDDLDLRILTCLMADATRPYTDIAQELFVSSGTVHVRMKKLRELGVVSGAHMEVDVRRLGFDIIAFIGVIFEKDIESIDALDALKSIPEVVEAYYVTGGYGLFVKVICRDSAQLLHVLRDRVQRIDGVARTETFILLEEGIHRQIPLE